MTHWSRIFVDRPVATLMVVAAVVVFGWISLRQLPVNLMPDVSYPTITVRDTYTGAAPSEVEREIIDPLEDALRTVQGVVSVESVSRSGYGEVYLRFRWGSDLDVATQHVRERLALAKLPDGISKPRILRYDPSLDPVFRIALSGRSSERLGHYARRELAPALSSAAGVALVRVRGGGETLVRVEVEPDALARHALRIQRVKERLQAENISLVGGRLNSYGREVLIRTDSEMHSLQALRRLVVTMQDGIAVRLGDISTIERVVKPPKTFTTWRGKPSVELDVYREADANLVSVVDEVRARLYDGEDALVGKLPPGVSLDVSADASHYVRAAIDEVKLDAFLGALCAVFVLFLFLRSVYPTVVISLAIPLSVIAVFAPMRWAGISLNVMSLGGLALGVGMVVDNAVVVLEAIYRRGELGDAPREAALTGTREVAGAVIASTGTTVAVFAPIVFMTGVASLFFRDLGASVALALIASLVFSLCFVPTLLALRGRHVSAGAGALSPHGAKAGMWALRRFGEDRAALRKLRGDYRGIRLGALWLVSPPLYLIWSVRTLIYLPLEWVFRRLGGRALAGGARVIRGVQAWQTQRRQRSKARARGARFLRRYERAIGWVLEHGVVVWMSILVLFVAAVLVWPHIGLQLVPSQQENAFDVRLSFPSSTPLTAVAKRSAAIERRILAISHVASTASAAGRDERGSQPAQNASHVSRIRVQLASSDDPSSTYRAVVKDIRAVLRRVPGVQWRMQQQRLVATRPAIRVDIVGDDLEVLRDNAQAVEDMLADVRGVVDVRNPQQRGNDELVVHLIADKLATFGLSAQAVAEQVRAMSRGVRATTLHLDERRLDVEVRAPVDTSLGALKALQIPLPRQSFGRAMPTTNTPSIGGMDLADVRRSSAQSADLQTTSVRLDALADFEVRTGPSEIRHVDGARTAIVQADANVRDVGGLIKTVRDGLQELSFDRGVRVDLAGQQEDIEAAKDSLFFAFWLAIFLVYAVMASLFESFVGPLLIMITVPLALAAVLLALFATGIPISILVLMGAIVLVGIVVNNAIVLMDAMLQLERGGMVRRDAAIKASSIRLRPVMITAMTTVLGLLPMLFAHGEGAELRQPLALVLVVGLSVSTVLTLVVIPLLYKTVMPPVARRGPTMQ